jgi:MoaA/NifB/PqqE/SkfB family radical SAM enzyme
MDGGFSTELFSQDGKKNPNRFIPTEKVKEILDDCAAMGVKAIEFTGGGEPTVHKDWQQILGYAQSLGLQTGLVTNGVRLKDCLEVRSLTWLRISLDAGTPETYERIRQSTAWPKVMDTLKMAGTIKGPLVGVGFVVTKENYKELAQAARITKEAGIPYIRVSAMFSTYGPEYYNGIFLDISQQRMAAKRLETDTFKVVDFFADRVADLKQHAPNYSFCGEQQYVLYIGGDQNVYTCCTNAYTTKGILGSLKEQRFSEFLEKTRRYDFDAKQCGTCQFNGKNEILNYLISDPAHVEFI